MENGKLGEKGGKGRMEMEREDGLNKVCPDAEVAAVVFCTRGISEWHYLE